MNIHCWMHVLCEFNKVKDYYSNSALVGGVRSCTLCFFFVFIFFPCSLIYSDWWIRVGTNDAIRYVSVWFIHVRLWCLGSRRVGPRHWRVVGSYYAIVIPWCTAINSNKPLIARCCGAINSMAVVVQKQRMWNVLRTQVVVSRTTLRARQQPECRSTLSAGYYGRLIEMNILW